MLSASERSAFTTICAGKVRCTHQMHDTGETGGHDVLGIQNSCGTRVASASNLAIDRAHMYSPTCASNRLATRTGRTGDVKTKPGCRPSSLTLLSHVSMNNAPLRRKNHVDPLLQSNSNVVSTKGTVQLRTLLVVDRSDFSRCPVRHEQHGVTLLYSTG